MTTAQRPQPTWLTEAELRRQPVGSIAYDGGTGTVRFLDLPQAGYLSHLQGVTKVGATLAAIPTKADDTGFINGAASQYRVYVNTEGTLFDLDGMRTAIVGAIDMQYNTGDGRVYPYPQNSFDWQPGVNAFVDKWLHRIPLALYLSNVPYPIGLYNTALQNLSIRLQQRWLPIGEAANLLPDNGLYVATNPTTYTGQSDWNEEYFEPIPYPSAQPPLRYVHRWTQFEVPINTSSGVVDVPLPGRSKYVRMIYCVYDGTSNNVTLSDSILTQLQLTFGVQSHIHDETYDQVKARMRKQYGRLMDSMPGGIYTHDFVADTHTARDWFDAGRVTNARAQLTFSGAHTGTGSKIVCATEEVLTLAQAGPSYAALNMVGN